MTPEEAEYTALMLMVDLEWPKGVTPAVMVPMTEAGDGVLTLVLKAHGVRDRVYRFGALLTAATLQSLIRDAREMLAPPPLTFSGKAARMFARKADHPGLGPEDCTEPPPHWLVTTRSLIAAHTGAPARCRAALEGLASALEFDAVPVPHVFRQGTCSLVLAWDNGPRNRVEVAATVTGAVVVRADIEGMKTYVKHFTVAARRSERGRAVDAAREQLALCLGMTPITAGDMGAV